MVAETHRQLLGDGAGDLHDLGVGRVGNIDTATGLGGRGVAAGKHLLRDPLGPGSRDVTTHLPGQTLVELPPADLDAPGEDHLDPVRDCDVGGRGAHVDVHRALDGLLRRGLHMIERADHADDLAVDPDGLELAPAEQIDVPHHGLAADRETDHLRQRLAVAVNIGDVVGPHHHAAGRHAALAAELHLDGLFAVEPRGIGNLHVLDHRVGAGDRADHPAALEAALAEHPRKLLLQVVEPGVAIASQRIGNPQPDSRMQRRRLAGRRLHQFDGRRAEVDRDRRSLGREHLGEVHCTPPKAFRVHAS